MRFKLVNDKYNSFFTVEQNNTLGFEDQRQNIIKATYANQVPV